MTWTPPPELAPAQVARVEALLEEVPLATPPRPRRTADMRKPCHVCRRKSGRMGFHHLVPGDDASVVPVHHSCHRKLHVTVWVRSVEVEQHRICVPTSSQDPGDCDKHDHVPGAKELRVGLDVAGGSEDEWRAMVGKIFTLKTGGA